MESSDISTETKSVSDTNNHTNESSDTNDNKPPHASDSAPSSSSSQEKGHAETSKEEKVKEETKEEKKDEKKEEKKVAKSESKDNITENKEDAKTEIKPLWGRLVSLSDKYKNVDLREESVTIGRSASQCQVVVDSLAVSGKHCSIIRQKNEYKGGAKTKVDYTVLIKDTSTNGTFVNGEPVGRNNTKLLFDGCEISLLPKKTTTERIAFIFQDCYKEEAEIEQGGPQAVYEMKKELGTGTFASVRLAVHRATGEEFAIKIIDKKKFLSKSKRPDSIKDEVKVLEAVSHPNILQIKGVFETPTTLYLVLELATGGELFDRIVKGAQPEDTAREIFHQILLAIKYLHDKGIAHRDLKPENAPDSNTIKISDFGLSKMIDEGTYMKTVCGTPQYVAPEILTKAEKEGYGKAVDMWSLGVILFVLLGGYPNLPSLLYKQYFDTDRYTPFEEDSKDRIPLFEKVKKAKYSFSPKRWNHISDDAKDLISTLLVVDPTKRLTADQALAHRWIAQHTASNGEAEAEEAEADSDKKSSTPEKTPKLTEVITPSTHTPISARRKRARVSSAEEDEPANAKKAKEDSSDSEEDSKEEKQPKKPAAAKKKPAAKKGKATPKKKA